MITTGADHTVRTWDVTASGSRDVLTIGDPHEVNGVGFSTDGSRLLTFDACYQTRVWDAVTGTLMHASWHPDGGSAEFISNGSRYATSGLPAVYDASSGKVITKMKLQEGEWTANVAVSPDGSLVAGGLGDTTKGTGTVIVWNASSGAKIETLGEPAGKFDAVRGLAFSPDGTLLAGLTEAGTLHLWNVSSGRDILTFQAHRENGHGISFSPDGSLLATSAAEGVAVWRIPTGERVETLTGASNIEDVTFSPDARLLATAGGDNTAGIWDVATGRQTLTLYGHSAALTAVVFSPDGSKLATSSLDGSVREYVLSVDALIALARSRLTRGFTDAECRQYLHLDGCPASPGIASPMPSALAATAAEGTGPDGAWRTTIVAEDLLRVGFRRSQVEGNDSDYTMIIAEDAWHLHQDQPGGETWDVEGTLAGNGDRITFTDRSLPDCFGFSMSAHWDVRGTLVVFSDPRLNAGPCGDDPIFRAWVRGVLGSHPWARVV